MDDIVSCHVSDPPIVLLCGILSGFSKYFKQFTTKFCLNEIYIIIRTSPYTQQNPPLVTWK